MQMTPFSAKPDGRSVVDELKISSLILVSWLKNNYMKANIDKSHLLLSEKNNFTSNIDGNVIESEDNQVLLSITIDSNFSFNKHINPLHCNSGGREKINLNFYFHTSLWCLKRFYEGL